MGVRQMNIHEVRQIYCFPPVYSDEVGRFVSKKGATYRAWYDGRAHRIDADANDRRYGDEGMEFFSWKEEDVSQT
jgi:hypothetical protein